MSSREKIVNAAVELFYRRGYQATSIDDIIAVAFVCKSNFYYHFKSKEELGVEVLDQRKDQFKQVMATTLNNAELMPRQRLESFLELILQAQDTRLGKCGCPFGNLIAEMAEHNERIRCEISQMFDGVVSHVECMILEGQNLGQFRSDVVAGDVAALVIETVQGMLLMTKCHKSVDSLRRGSHVLIQLLTNDQNQ